MRSRSLSIKLVLSAYRTHNLTKDPETVISQFAGRVNYKTAASQVEVQGKSWERLQTAGGVGWAFENIV